ncbi:MAG TPA: hypothetical protein VGM90_33315 [Kofleriaceae bacterium]
MKAFVAVVLLAACGNNDVDLTGAYEITSEVDSMPCGADQPVTNGAAFLVFKSDELFGTKYFTFSECADAEATDCSSTGSLFNSLTEPTDNGWNGHITSWSGAGGQCGMSVVEEDATLSGNTLTLDVTDRSGTIALPDSECTKDAPDDHVNELECTEHHGYIAVKR